MVSAQPRDLWLLKRPCPSLSWPTWVGWPIARPVCVVPAEPAVRPIELEFPFHVCWFGLWLGNSPSPVRRPCSSDDGTALSIYTHGIIQHKQPVCGLPKKEDVSMTSLWFPFFAVVAVVSLTLDRMSAQMASCFLTVASTCVRLLPYRGSDRTWIISLRYPSLNNPCRQWHRDNNKFTCSLNQRDVAE